MLAKNEFDLRVSQAFASRTCTQLAALTADLPAGVVRAQPRGSARTQGEMMRRPGRMMGVATALYAGVLATVFLVPWTANSEGDPLEAIFLLFFLSTFIYLFVMPIGLMNMAVLWREKRSGGQLPPQRAHGGPALEGERDGSAGNDLMLCQAHTDTHARRLLAYSHANCARAFP